MKEVQISLQEDLETLTSTKRWRGQPELELCRGTEASKQKIQHLK